MDRIKFALCVVALAALVSQHCCDALLCHMCGTSEYPDCQPNPGPVIGCPAGTRCWTLYDDVMKENVKARGCSYTTDGKDGCARGPQGSWRCFCGDKHLCNKR